MEEKWQSHIDKIIREAQERGEFDISAFKGKPLTDDPNAVHAGDRAMANKVLANHGHAPPFLMKKREIDEALEKERERLIRYVRRRRELLAAADAATDTAQAAALREQAESDWAWVLRRFEAALPDINKNIELFNLMNRIPNLHKMKVRLDWEIARAERLVDEGESSG